MRNQHHRKEIRSDIHQCQAHAIDGDRAFWNHQPRQFRRAAEADHLPFALNDAFRDAADGVDMPLNEMAAQSIADAQRSLQIDSIAGLQFAEIGFQQCFRPDLKAESFLPLSPRPSNKRR